MSKSEQEPPKYVWTITALLTGIALILVGLWLLARKNHEATLTPNLAATVVDSQITLEPADMTQIVRTTATTPALQPAVTRGDVSAGAGANNGLDATTPTSSVPEQASVQSGLAREAVQSTASQSLAKSIMQSLTQLP